MFVFLVFCIDLSNFITGIHDKLEKLVIENQFFWTQLFRDFHLASEIVSAGLTRIHFTLILMIYV